MRSKPKLLVITAMDGKKVIGYKIEYELDDKKFYSWLDGVYTIIESMVLLLQLMKKQHQYLKENGYCAVQTKTMNRWRSMLVNHLELSKNP
ncbi:hypothetical protein [Salinibacillus kushneri]|nr:hypothetical protein [Salinibacillus kushneri]